MNIIDIHEVPQDTVLVSIDDTAMFLNLFYHKLVDELLESFTDFTDADIMQEIVDTVGLDIICVIENNHGLLIHGYFSKSGVLA